MEEWTMTWKVALSVGCTVGSYLFYYFLHLRSKVELIANLKNEFSSKIINSSKLLNGHYSPTWWVFNRHLQGVLLMKSRPVINPNYFRENLTAVDGATLELDWSHSHDEILPEGTPIAFMLTGVTGNSSSSYMTYLTHQFQLRNWRSVVMNYPGATGSPLTSARFFCVDSVSDTKQVIDHIHTLYPKSPIVAIGFSLGGHFVMRYLQEVGEETPVISAMVISAPWSSAKCTNFWKKKFINERVYDLHFLDKFQGNVIKNKEVFKKSGLNVEAIVAAKTMEELHSHLSVPLYNVKTVDEYYAVNASDEHIAKVKIPFLVLHAWNDPVVPRDAVPIDELKKNEHAVVATTKSGGHTGWLTGWSIKGLAWCEQVSLEFSLLSLEIYNKKL